MAVVCMPRVFRFRTGHLQNGIKHHTVESLFQWKGGSNCDICDVKGFYVPIK